MPRVKGRTNSDRIRLAARQPEQNGSIEAHLGRLIVPRADGCWIWSGKLTVDGYGQMPKPVNGTKVVHRWVYETCFGPVPPGHHVHHRCRNRACCNPAHLVALTPAEHAQQHRDERRRAAYRRRAGRLTMPLWAVIIPTILIVVLAVVGSVGQAVKDIRASRREEPH